MTCEVNHVGEMTTILHIASWENREESNDSMSIDSRDWLISGIRVKSSSPLRMRAMPQPTKNTITSMRLQVSNGGNLTSDQIPYYTWNLYDNTVELHADVATYIAPNQTKTNAEYWVLPCINLVLDGATLAYKYTNLRRHPLRVFPIPEKTDDFLVSDASGIGKRLDSP